MTDYPIFSLAPDWSNSNLTESFEWLTRIYQAKGGAEQRSQVRPIPRRYYEMDFMVYGPTQSFYTTFVRKFGAQDFLIPLWPLQDTLAAEMGDADTTATLLSPPYSEIRAGTQAIFWRSFTDYLVLDVQSVEGAVVTFAAAPGQSVTTGYKLYPLRLARFTDTTKLTRVGDRMLTGSAKVVLRQGEPIIGSAPADDQYVGFNVLNEAPDENQTVQVGFDTLVDTKTSEAAQDFFVDTAGFSFATQQNTYFIVGKDQRNKFLARLAKLNGQLVPVWLPTFAMDFDLASDVNSSDNFLVIEACNFTALGGPTQGLNVVRIEKYDGTLLYRAVVSSLQSTQTTEKIILGAIVGSSFSTTDVKRISFMALSRMSADMVDLVHQTDGEGLSQATLSFRAAPDLRQATAWLPYDPCSGSEVPTISYSWSYTGLIPGDFADPNSSYEDGYDTPAHAQTAAGVSASLSCSETPPYSLSISYDSTKGSPNDYANLRDGETSAANAASFVSFIFGIGPWVRQQNQYVYIDPDNGQLQNNQTSAKPYGAAFTVSRAYRVNVYTQGDNTFSIITVNSGMLQVQQTAPTLTAQVSVDLTLAGQSNLATAGTPAVSVFYSELAAFSGASATSDATYSVGVVYQGFYDPSDFFPEFTNGQWNYYGQNELYFGATIYLVITMGDANGVTVLGTAKIPLTPDKSAMPLPHVDVTIELATSGLTVTAVNANGSNSATIPVDLSSISTWSSRAPSAQIAMFYNYSASIALTSATNYTLRPIEVAEYTTTFMFSSIHGYFSSASDMNAAALNNNWGLLASQTSNGAGIALSIPNGASQFDETPTGYGGTVVVNFALADVFSKAVSNSITFSFPAIAVPSTLDDPSFDPHFQYTAELQTVLNNGDFILVTYYVDTTYVRGQNNDPLGNGDAGQNFDNEVTGKTATGYFNVQVYVAATQTSTEHDMPWGGEYSGTIGLDITNSEYIVYRDGIPVYSGNETNNLSGAVAMAGEASADVPLYMAGSVSVNFTSNMR